MVLMQSSSRRWVWLAAKEVTTGTCAVWRVRLVLSALQAGGGWFVN